MSFNDVVIWIIVVITPIAFVWAWIDVGVKDFREKRRKRRLQQGQCEWCGQDVRSNPDVCSHCGRKSLFRELKDLIESMRDE